MLSFLYRGMKAVGKFIWKAAVAVVSVVSLCFATVALAFFSLFKWLFSKPKHEPTPKRERHVLPSGQVLEGPYKTLGNGAFGAVYEYTLNGKPVAVKKPRESRYNEMQQQELSMLRTANPHPNIISYITHAEVNQQTWIVMELMKCSLREFLDNNPNLSWAMKLELAIQIMEAVVRLSEIEVTTLTRKQIVHQDLKPENFLMNQSKATDPKTVKVKLTDFGIAREVDQLTLSIFGNLTYNLSRGDVGGTLQYLAPEVIRAIHNNSCNPKSDVFSAGIILWEIATGKPVNRQEDEIMNGTLHVFTEDEKTKTRRVIKNTFWGTQVTAEPTYPKCGFFGPTIKKCIQPEPGKRCTPRQALEELKQIRIPVVHDITDSRRSPQRGNPIDAHVSRTARRP